MKLSDYCLTYDIDSKRYNFWRPGFVSDFYLKNNAMPDIRCRGKYIPGFLSIYGDGNYFAQLVQAELAFDALYIWGFTIEDILRNQAFNNTAKFEIRNHTKQH